MIAWNRWAALRVAVLVLVAILLQAVAVSQVDFFGVTAQLAPIIVVVLALFAGSEVGAFLGFLVGVCVDMALMQTVGISSLVFVGVGYGAGRLGEQGKIISKRWLPPMAGALGTLGSIVAYVFIQYMLGLITLVNMLVLREVVVTTALNAILAIPIFYLTRIWLKPYLPREVVRPRRRRRSRRRHGGTATRGARVPA